MTVAEDSSGLGLGGVVYFSDCIFAIDMAILAGGTCLN